MSAHRRRLSIGLGLVALSLVVAAPVADAAPKTKLVSKSTDADGADATSFRSSSSATGRFVAFTSEATDLIGNDKNGGTADVFVYDHKKKVQLISRSKDADGADSHSDKASISASGRFVAFQSSASDLIGNDKNGNVDDIFVYDRSSKKMRLISKDRNGNGANGESDDPAISANGRFIAFSSRASDLVGNDKNGDTEDIFLYDRKSGKMRLISKSTDADGADGRSFDPSISADGRFVAFSSNASDLVGNDKNGGTRDIFLYDRKSKKMRLISKSTDADGADGSSGHSSISASGRFVAFDSGASDLIGNDKNGGTSDIFVYDKKSKKMKLISKSTDADGADDFSAAPSISASGRFVAFEAEATDLVGNDKNGEIEDIFVYDRKSKKMRLISKSTDADGADRSSLGSSISADGRFVAFESTASDLIGADKNGNIRDIFRRGPLR